MSKFSLNPLQVKCKENKPANITVGTYSLNVKSILEHWYDTGCWWEGESEKSFYRLSCYDKSIIEIYQDLSTLEWFLYKIYD